MEGFLRAFPREGSARLVIHTDAQRDWGSPRRDIEIDDAPLTRSGLLGRYREFDLFVSASLGEGLGLPVAEAILAGVPVVANDWGGHRSLLRAGAFFALPHTVVPQPFCSRPDYFAAGQRCAVATCRGNRQDAPPGGWHVGPIEKPYGSQRTRDPADTLRRACSRSATQGESLHHLVTRRLTSRHDPLERIRTEHRLHERGPRLRAQAGMVERLCQGSSEAGHRLGRAVRTASPRRSGRAPSSDSPDMWRPGTLQAVPRAGGGRDPRSATGTAGHCCAERCRAPVSRCTEVPHDPLDPEIREERFGL